MKRITLILMLLSINMYAQGEYIDRGNNAFGAGVSIALHQKIYGLAAMAGISTLGTFDIGLSYAYLIAKENESNVKPNSTAISTFANIHIIKQSDFFPFSLSGIIQYQIHKYSFNYSDQSKSLGFWTYGGSIFHSFNVSEKYSIQPFITFVLTSPVNEKNINTVSSTNLSIAFISKMGKRNFIIHPSISLSENETVYSLSFEFVNIISN